MRTFLNVVKVCTISVVHGLTILNKNMAQIKKTNNIYRYMVGCIIQGYRTKRYFLFKKRFSKAFRNMVEVYTKESLKIRPSKMIIDELCFDISTHGKITIDYEKRSLNFIKNFFGKVAGIGY